jgi:SAM-dependent methyltransferase
MILTTCAVCGSSTFRLYRTRVDGVGVFTCETCGMGFADAPLNRLDEIYEDAYFDAPDGARTGYVDFGYTSEHSVAWAAALVALLAPPPGRVLDIGCANGDLLAKLAPTYSVSGIEINATMAATAERRGIEILRRDLFGPAGDAEQASFDVVTAIAVLEHVSDIRRGAETALALLKPGGTFLFEVPLIGGPEEDVWFNSSLEHVAYPSEAALSWLFERELGVPLAASRDRARSLLDEPFEALETSSARAFRLLFDVVHLGAPLPFSVACLADLASAGAVNPTLLRRLGELWARDLRRLEEARGELASARSALDEVRSYLTEVEAARDWYKAREDASSDSSTEV